MNLVLLEDDKHLQPAQNMVPIASKELADARRLGAGRYLERDHRQLTTRPSRSWVPSINIDHSEIPDVARKFLKDNGLI
jgi:glycine betaine/choline ABC-type transport system substrate-binding protein